MKLPTVSGNPEVQSRYEEMRRKGESHAMAEMLAARRPPNLNGTDTAFWRGKMLNNGLEDNFMGERMRKLARKAGIDIAGKVYMGQLADTRGAEDPKAWVSDTGDIKKLCETNGWGCEGSVRVKGAEPPPPTQVRMAEDLIAEKAAEILRQNPDRAKNLMELREEIIEKHGSKRDDVNFAPVSETKPKRKIRKVV